MVYDGLAKISDIDAPYTVVVRKLETYEEARIKAIEALVDHLTSIGLIEGKAGRGGEGWRRERRILEEGKEWEEGRR